MKTFKIEQSQLVKVWLKLTVEIEAETEEEAKEKVKAFADKDITMENLRRGDTYLLDTETEFESVVILDPKENEGRPTIITEFEDGEKIGDNAK